MGVGNNHIRWREYPSPCPTPSMPPASRHLTPSQYFTILSLTISSGDGSDREVDTSSEVDDEVEHEDGVGDAIEDDPVNTEVVVKERDGDWENDKISNQQQQHYQVPVEPIPTLIQVYLY